MYLKKITASGFKSFADRVTLTLEKNQITGIVGPNGSGKSNVIDAVRWVMGEQNAKMLRGEKATDIIFAGSQKRKALSIAEVSLVFDNSKPSAFCPPEYRFDTEVSLTRKIYADGEREFFINNKPCRLKDIIHFFSSTGLGGRSYSMIQQGQVDRILQAKPEELREILEEASGTIIFKRQKAETQRKIDLTNFNLSRIDDILAELCTQSEKLKDQVSKAKKWEELNELLTQKESELLIYNAQNFDAQKSSLQDTLTKEAELVQKINDELISKEHRLTYLKEEIEKKDPELFQLNEKNILLRENLATYETIHKTNQELIESAKIQVTKVGLDKKTIEKELNNLHAAYSSGVQEFEQTKKDVQEKSQVLEELDYQTSILSEEATVFEGRKEDIVTELSKVTREFDTLKLKKESILRESEHKLRDKDELLTKIERLEHEFSRTDIVEESLRLKLSQLQREIHQFLEEKKENDLKLATLKKDQQQLNTDTTELNEKYFEVKGLYNATKESLKTLSSGEFASKAQLAFPNEIVFLPDIIDYTDKAQNISEEAKKAIDLWLNRFIVDKNFSLKKLKELAIQEKAAQFSLSLKSDGEEEEAVSQYPDATALTEFLSCKEGFSDAIHFLKSVYYIDHEASQNISLKPHETFFTKDGIIFSGVNHLTFTNAQEEGFLSKKNKIEAYAQKADALEKRLTNKKAQTQKNQQNIENTEKSLLGVNENLADLQKKQFTLLGELNSFQYDRKKRQEELVSLRVKYREISERTETIELEIADLEDSIQRLGDERHSLKRGLDDLTEQNLEMMDRYEEVKRQHDSLKIEIAALKGQLEPLKRSVEASAKQHDFLKENFQQKTEELEQLSKQLELAKTKDLDAQEKIKELLEERRLIEESLVEKREAHSGLFAEQKVLEQETKEKREKIAKLNEAITSKKIELERIQVGIENLKEQMQQSGSSFEELLSKQKKQIDPKKHQKEISAIKGEMDHLGAVNMIAVSEYKTIHERIEFISAQREEVVASRNLLEVAIQEIEESSQEKFLKTFLTLNSEFQQLFPILFPGGNAHITLTDEKDLLNSGVEIIVRLPGKKSQSMRLFSGGEKALTAIALIFALLKSKPTPFCFLDEVDAALDETNVTRYNRVLESLSDRFQFIVITHRRRTMEVLDVLYGVTMQEPGVSKVVGVDLTTDLPAHLKKSIKDPQFTTPALLQ